MVALLTIFSLLSVLGLGAGVLSLIKIKRLYDLIKKEDITVEENGDIVIKNGTF